MDQKDIYCPQGEARRCLHHAAGPGVEGSDQWASRVAGAVDCADSITHDAGKTFDIFLHSYLCWQVSCPVTLHFGLRVEHLDLE